MSVDGRWPWKWYNFVCVNIPTETNSPSNGIHHWETLKGKDRKHNIETHSSLSCRWSLETEPFNFLSFPQSCPQVTEQTSRLSQGNTKERGKNWGGGRQEWRTRQRKMARKMQKRPSMLASQTRPMNRGVTGLCFAPTLGKKKAAVIQKSVVFYSHIFKWYFLSPRFAKCFNFTEVKITLQWTRVHLYEQVLFTFLLKNTALWFSIYKHLKNQQTVCGQHCEWNLKWDEPQL